MKLSKRLSPGARGDRMMVVTSFPEYSPDSNHFATMVSTGKN
jgi:hypothetical protein